MTLLSWVSYLILVVVWRRGRGERKSVKDSFVK